MPQYYGTLPSTPAIADPGLIADGLRNYTVLNSRFAMSLGAVEFEFARGDVVALRTFDANPLVSQGALAIIP